MKPLEMIAAPETPAPEPRRKRTRPRVVTLRLDPSEAVWLEDHLANWAGACRPCIVTARRLGRRLHAKL